MGSITKNWDIMIMGKNEKLRKLNWIYNDDMIMGKKGKNWAIMIISSWVYNMPTEE